MCNRKEGRKEGREGGREGGNKKEGMKERGEGGKEGRNIILWTLYPFVIIQTPSYFLGAFSFCSTLSLLLWIRKMFSLPLRPKAICLKVIFLLYIFCFCIYSLSLGFARTLPSCDGSMDIKLDIPSFCPCAWSSVRTPSCEILGCVKFEFWISTELFGGLAGCSGSPCIISVIVEFGEARKKKEKS